MTEFWPEFWKLQQAGEPCVCVTLVEGRGSVPQNVGAKMLVTRAGLYSGSVGGGKIEARALRFAEEMLRGPQTNALESWNLQTDLGMTCGGAVRLWFEAFNLSHWPIAVFGAGHIAQSLVPLLLTFDCSLSCFDSRVEWLERLPASPRLRRMETDDLAAQVATLSEKTFVLILTMGHATDLPVLRAALKREFPFVGVIGSKNKANTLRRTLAQEGFCEEEISRFFCPLGLSLGNNQPAEIAVSIAAQLLQVRDRLGL